MRLDPYTIGRMTIVNRAVYHNPTPEAMRALMERIGKSQIWVADRTGISRRRIQYLLVGSKEFNGETQKVKLTYPEQHILECLADSSDALKDAPKPDHPFVKFLPTPKEPP